MTPTADTFDPFAVTALALSAFIAIWCGTLYIIARIGGWHTLAQKYPMPGSRPSYELDPMSPIEQSASFGSLTLRGGGILPAANYNGVVTFAINRSAILVSVFMPFRPGHETIYIPFRDIAANEVPLVLGFRAVELQLARSPGLRIIVSQNRAKWIAKHSNGTLTIYDRQR